MVPFCSAQMVPFYSALDSRVRQIPAQSPKSQFRTPKYRPESPGPFGCVQGAHAFGQRFFAWYNDEHRHSGLGLLTPAMVHFGDAPAVLARRQTVLDATYQAHPEHFVRTLPRPLPLPSAVWINKPPPPDTKTGKERH